MKRSICCFSWVLAHCHSGAVAVRPPRNSSCNLSSTREFRLSRYHVQESAKAVINPKGKGFLK